MPYLGSETGVFYHRLCQMSKKPAGLVLNPAWGIVLRVSDEDRQRPEISIPAQRSDVMARLVAPSGLPVFREYIDLASAKTTSRENFQHMLADARAGCFSHLGFQNWDRFSRRLTDALTIEDELRALGIQLCAADMAGIDVTTSGGWLSKTVRQVVAQAENMQHAERVVNRMREALQQGIWMWRAPDGYQTLRTYLTPQKYLREIKPDPDRAPVIVSIFERLSNGRYAMQQIARELNAEGHRQPCGALWTKQAVYRHLVNEFYAGWVVSPKWGIRAQGKHEPLVTQELFDECRRLLRDHSHHPQRRRYVYALGDVLWSAELDQRMYSTTCKGQRCDWMPYYYTTGRLGPHRLYVPARDVEVHIPDLLRQLYIPAEQCEALRAEYEQDLEQAIQQRWPAERANLQRQISALQNEQVNLVRLLSKGTLGEEEFLRVRTEMETELATAQQKLRHFTRVKSEEVDRVERAIQLLGKADTIWERLSESQDRKELINLIFQRIVVDRHGNVLQVVLWPPLDWLQQQTSAPAMGSAGSIPVRLSGPNRTQLEPIQPLQWPAPSLVLALDKILCS